MCCNGVLPDERIEVVRRMLSEPLAVPVRSLMVLLAFPAGGDDGERFLAQHG